MSRARPSPVAEVATPVLGPLDLWRPRSQPQAEALGCPADIMLFGGAAGSLKSETLLVDAARERQRPGLRALLLRRSFPELERTLIRRSRALYAGCGATFNETRKCWRFPSGAMVEFGYCESDDDVYRYQGAEFSFIGFDESTHFGEFPIRYMLSRLRSTDPSLSLRLRLASNPGNVGHNVHKELFLGGYCPHCHPELARKSSRLYHDVCWPSDRHPVGKSVCFIPGKVSDHDLLSPAYAANLASLGGSFRKALLEGCWEVYEGQYFDNWDPTRMVITRQRIREEPWWPHWLGVDYGFNGSQAAAYLLCKSPPSVEFPHGRTYVLREFTARRMPAEEFGRELQENFSGAAKLAACYLSPDAWANRGDGHTLADQMQQSSGLAFEPASNDRIGGAMLLYSQLDRGELVIADTCTQLLAALPSRIHDPARPDDIRKVAGDPYDDCVDALRYAVYSYIAPACGGGRRQEETASTDATIAALQRRLAAERQGGWRAGEGYVGRNQPHRA